MTEHSEMIPGERTSRTPVVQQHARTAECDGFHGRCPDEIPQRAKMVKGRAVPLYPDECEPHTPSPDGYLQWHAWAEQMAETHANRQCKGCGLWAIWEPKQDPEGKADINRHPERRASEEAEEYCVVHDQRLKRCKEPDRCREQMRGWGLYADPAASGAEGATL